jgi:hypothetical protein
MRCLELHVRARLAERPKRRRICCFSNHGFGACPFKLSLHRLVVPAFTGANRLPHEDPEAAYPDSLAPPLQVRVSGCLRCEGSGRTRLTCSTRDLMARQRVHKPQACKFRAVTPSPSLCPRPSTPLHHPTAHSSPLNPLSPSLTLHHYHHNHHPPTPTPPARSSSTPPTARLTTATSLGSRWWRATPAPLASGCPTASAASG